LASCKNSSESIPVIHNSSQEVEKNIEIKKLPEYDYSAAGTDEDGNHVNGNINIEGTIGLGTLIRYDAKEIEIVVERSGKQKIIATDLEGYKYNLKIR
jgi:hypothetical protein